LSDLDPRRNIIKRLVPQQGEGPSQDMLDNGYLQIGFWGRGTGAGGEEVVVKGGVYALHGDPGYRCLQLRGAVTCTRSQYND
jgi:hypothetical protein